MKRDKYGDLESEDSEDFPGLSPNDEEEIDMLNFEHDQYHPFDKEILEDLHRKDDDYDDEDYIEDPWDLEDDYDEEDGYFDDEDELGDLD